MPLTNEDKSRKLNKLARQALIKSVSRKWDRVQEIVKQAARSEIDATNLARQIGIELQEIGGHEQALFRFFHGEDGKLLPGLPVTMTFKALKFCVHLARKMEKPAETLDEARAARQMMFEAFGECPSPRRASQQIAHTRNPWNDFVSGTQSLVTLFSNLEEAPMTDWESEKLRVFIRETEPVVTKHNEAKTIFAGRSE